MTLKYYIYNIKRDFIRIEYKTVDQIHVAQDKVEWRDAVNIVITFRVLQNTENSLTTWDATSSVCSMGRDSSDGDTGWKAEVRFVAGARDFSLRRRPALRSTQPPLLITGDYFTRGQAAGA
jgi:hypothetical protein